MSRKAMIASFASAIAFGLAAFSAQAAPVVTKQGGVHDGAGLVQQAYYRYYRHHHRYWRWHHHHRHYR
jgi:hypothetical protein